MVEGAERVLNRAEYQAQSDYCKYMASTTSMPEKKAAWHELAAAWQTLADGRQKTDDRHQIEQAAKLTCTANIPVELEERVEELRRIAAKTQNAGDREKLLKLAGDFEACAHRLSTARFSLALALRWGRAEERLNPALPEIANHPLKTMGKR
jgi:dihydroorotase-like cyclic amidohydrolase